MARNLGVTVEVFNRLTTRQKRIIQKSSNKDMFLIGKQSNVLTHKRTLGLRNATVIRLKSGEKILISK